MKKAIQVSLTAVLLVSVLLAGCSSNSQTPAGTGQATGQPTETAAPTAASEEPIELRWLSFDFPEGDDSPVQRWIEQKFNVKLINMRIDRANWRDQLNIRLATNELPDVWLLWGMSDVRAYYDQGLLGELPVEEIREHMPSLAAFIDERQPTAWSDGLIDGKNYGIPITNLEGVLPMHPIYNTQWLEKAGFSEAPKTIGELERALYSFRNDDPDNNGKKDTYGLTAHGRVGLADSLQYVFSAYHTMPNYWQLDDQGELVYGMVTENAREALKLLNQWFKDGVLDPEFLTNDGKREEFINKKVGINSAGWLHFRPSGLLAQAAAGNNVDITVGKALAGPYGEGKLMAYGLTSNYFGMSVDAAEDPRKKAKIYEILNAFYSDEEAFLAGQYGLEGVHYDVVDGKVAARDEFKENPTRISLGMGNYYGLLSRKSSAFEHFLYPEEELAYRDELTSGVDLLFNQVKFSVPAISQYPDLPNIENEYLIKFITGEVNLEDGFDKFVELWFQSGGKLITEQVNEVRRQNGN